MSIAPPRLNDSQKADLIKIWSSHCRQQLDDSKAEVVLDERCTHFVASLLSYFLSVLTNPDSIIIRGDDVEQENSGEQYPRQSVMLETFRPFFLSLTDRSVHEPIPVMTHGQHVVLIDHASFLTEIENYEKRGSTHKSKGFGAFLYHRPSSGLCVTNSAIALTLMTLHRRSRIRRHTSADFLQTENNTILQPGSITLNARFYNVYPTIEIQDVKTSNAYKFVSIRGRIIKVHPKRLRLQKSDVMCIKCGEQFEHTFHDGRYEMPKRCGATGDNGKKCAGQKFDLLRRTAQYIDCQRLKLQENDVTSVAGRTPRQIELEVMHDLCDFCQAGDCVRVAGVINAVNSAVASGRSGKLVAETSTYHLFMAANSIVNTTAELNAKKKTEKGSIGESNGGLMFSDSQLVRITRVAQADHLCGSLTIRMAFPFDLLVRSLCPSIIGHNSVKAGILLGLLGGTPPSSNGLEDVKSGVSIRSSIHVLIVGDPGMGKSQMLLAITQVAARSVYVGGNTSSTTGLTVSLSKEAGGENGIEAGALVLADQGVCCLDEFDKMSKANHDGLLEAMEQQQISIAKAGVVASLPARCSVIAAANPRQGKYNMDKTVAENLNVPSPLLSRFDLVFILRDEVSDQDNLVSQNIMNLYRQPSSTHKNSFGVETGPQQKRGTLISDQMTMLQRFAWIAETQNPLPSDLLKEYISYAREYCRPKMTQEAAAVLKTYFMSLRYPDDGKKRNESVPITTRQLEALIRLAQARAKACLREFVLKEDAEDVIELMRDSVEQVHRDSSGQLDRTRGGVAGKSKRKQKKGFIDALKKSNKTAFSKDDFYRVSARLDLPLNDFWNMVDELRYCDQPELRKGKDGLYYLCV